MKKKRFYYAVVSFMRKGNDRVWSKASVTVMNDSNSSLFPLMDTIKQVGEVYSDIANLASLQIDNCIEISKEDYNAFRERLKKLDEEEKEG